MEQRSPEWFSARIGRVTASNVGAILGHDPWRTRDDVMRQMVREYHGAESEFKGNIATEYGTRNEEMALLEFQMETGYAVKKVGFITREDWAGCSPDGLIDDDCGLEIKCPFGKRKDAAPVFKTLAEQPHYYDQVQFSLWVTDAHDWLFYQWAPNGTALWRCIPNGEWQVTNLHKLHDFHREYMETIKDPGDNLAPLRVTIDTPEAHKMAGEYDQLSEAIDNATERRKEILADMVRIAGGRDAIFAGRKLTKIERAGSVSYAKALKDLALDADLEPYRGKPSAAWRLS